MTNSFLPALHQASKYLELLWGSIPHPDTSAWQTSPTVSVFLRTALREGGGATRRSRNNPLPGQETRSAGSQKHGSQRSPHSRQTGQIETIWLQRLPTPCARDNAFHYRCRAVTLRGTELTFIIYKMKCKTALGLFQMSKQLTDVKSV